MRLFAFPCAGAGASYYRNWAALFSADIDFIAVQLPGRENRFTEKQYGSLVELLPKLSEGLTPYLDLPFIFFGHSLGALLSFELTRTWKKEKKPLPRHLFVAGFRAPHLPNENPILHILPDPMFVNGEIR